MVNITKHGKPQVSLMIWGAIWLGERSDVILMERDSESPRNGYWAWSYIEALEVGLLPLYEPGVFFQQDNAKIHVANVTKAWFEDHGIWVIDWPAHSPDMNLIEYVWHALKILHRRHPDIHLSGDNVTDREVLKDWIRQA